jgi:hypothetical protein
LNLNNRHKWADVFQASWKKYPHPRRPDILHVDVINKEFNAETGTLTTTRIVFSKGPIPLWLRPIFGNTVGVLVEEAVMDPTNKTMKLLGKNLTFDSIVKTEELCTYKPSEENEEWTDFTQQAKVTSCVTGASSRIEDFILKQFGENATKGREIMEMAIQRVEQEHLAFAAAAHAVFL